MPDGKCRKVSKKIEKKFAEKCQILASQTFIYMTGGFWDNHSPHKIAYITGYCRRVAAVEPGKGG